MAQPFAAISGIEKSIGNLGCGGADSGLNLTGEQQAIIDFRAGVGQITAAPGSGKTYTLIERAKALIASGTRPETILILSFSTGARDVAQAVAPVGVKCQTIHSLAGELAGAAGLIPKGARIDDQQVERRALIGGLKRVGSQTESRSAREFLRDTRRDKRRVTALMTFLRVMAALDESSRSGHLAQPAHAKYKRFEEYLRRVNHAARKLRRKAEVFSFSDLLRLGKQALQARPSFGVQHIMVDEWQDSSPAAAALVMALAPHVKSLLVAGDPFQAVYQFAGARFVDLRTLGPAVTNFKLSTSFRLSPEHAAFANALIAGKSGEHNRLAICSLRSEGGHRPRLVRCDSMGDQHRFIAALIKQLTTSGVQAQTIAILGRTNAQVREAEQALRGDSIETQNIRPTDDSRRAFRTVLKVLRRMEKSASLNDWRRYLRQRAPDAKAVQINDAARRLYQVAQRNTFSSRYSVVAKVVVALLYAGRDRSDPKAKAARKADEHALNALQAITNKMTSAADLEAQLARADDKVTTGTLYAAKGGEWDHVFVLHVVKGSMPFFRSHLPEEELNAFYVACTRSRDQLYLMEAPYRNSRAHNQFKRASSFLRSRAVRYRLKMIRC